MAKGNAPILPGTARSGRKGGGTVPAGRYPSINGTTGVPANVPANLSALTGGRRGTTVVNSQSR